VPGEADYVGLLAELASARFSHLRDSQRAALDAYAAQHTTSPDLAVELPTGAGKSLIALLICEAWRREGASVAILTGNKTLARQMEGEADLLGVPVVRFEGPGHEIPLPERRRYHRARAVAVMNYWVLFNQNPVLDAPDLLVVDDAHLAEGPLDSLYSVAIERYAHPVLFEALMRELAARFPDYATFQDAVDDLPSRGGTELLSFLDQAAFAESMRSMIDSSAELATHRDLRYRWARIRERLHEVNIYCSTRTLWLRPYIYPLADNPHYANPTQRIYMSATIGDPADLARRLGTNPIVKLAFDADAERTLGRRLVVINPDDQADIPERLEAAILAALQVQPKSVWLCASKADADSYKQIVGEWLEANGLLGHPTWLLSAMGDEIDDFKAATCGHLFVGGRFDGMDFNAEECRLVVLATMPRAINEQEEFASSYLRDAAFMLARLNQRIVQALGRCNRADDDFAVYVMADRRFAAHFAQQSRRQGLSVAMQAEIDVAENHSELSAGELAGRVRRFLGRDFTGFDAELASALSEVPDGGQRPEPDSSEDEVTGWLELYERQDYRSAEALFRSRQEEYSRRGVRELGAFAQYSEAKAAFLEGRRGDAAAGARALAALQEAIDRGGAKSSWFNRLRSSLLRHTADVAAARVVNPDDYALSVVHEFDDLLDRVGTGAKFERWRARTQASLSSGSHDAYSQGLADLGGLLGYEATRPKYGAATDCRWRGVFGNHLELITFEAKIEHGPDAVIDPHAVGQAHNQRSRALQELGRRGYHVRGTIVSHVEEVEAAAVSSVGEIKLVRAGAVLALWHLVSGLLSIYRDAWSGEDVNARLSAAAALVPSIAPTGWLDRALTHPEMVVDEAVLLAEWPSR
jgi:hypothetical protein